MNKSIADQLERLILEASEITDSFVIPRWSGKVAVFLEATLGEEQETHFRILNEHNDFDGLARQLGLIRGIIANTGINKSKLGTDTEAGAAQKISPKKELANTRKVFVVHGHDEAAKEATARFLEKLDFMPIILHEQPSASLTIIEKFEKYSGDVEFAIVLMTPDDLGAARNNSDKLQPRARQNVILELGFFLGKLTRHRVCALYKKGVELPSDFQGVIYIEMDDGTGWKAKLTRELTEANYAIKQT